MPEGQVIKLVNATNLDNGLTSIANAIRTKGGTSADLTFPGGFVSAVEAIPTGGGGWTADDIASPGSITGTLRITGTSIMNYAFYGWSGITKLETPNLVTATDNCFGNMTGISSLYLPSMESFTGRPFANITAPAVFPALTALESRRLEGWKGSKLDIGSSFTYGFKSSSLYGCPNVNVVILRQASVVALQNANAFNSTKFASGGTGGTIYIPEALYDHLGDGSSDDYKANTYWATLDGYGTVTWAKIEGSIYETHYADGTPIT